MDRERKIREDGRRMAVKEVEAVMEIGIRGE